MNTPLAVPQQYLWLFDQLQPASTAYIVCRGWRLRGHLGVAALQGALDALVARNPSLRTGFHAVAGAPHATIEPFATVDLPIEEVASAEAEVGAARRLAAQPFDLARPPLMRALLLRRTDLEHEEHVLVLSWHHIAVDDWSVRLLEAQLAELYSGVERQAVQSVPYHEFAEWQRDHLRERLELDGSTAYWRDRLTGLTLPEFPSTPEGQAVQGASLSFPVPPATVAALREVAVRERATLFVVTLTALRLLLGRWLDVKDLAIGVPFAGRDLAGSENTVGLFVNALVLRTELDAGSDFAGAVATVRDCAFEAFDHHLMPYEWLPGLLTASNLRHKPLVRLGFQVLERPPGLAGQPRWHGLRVSPWDGFADTATRLDLEFHLTVTPEGGFDAVVNYRPSAVAASTVEDLAARYLLLLQKVGAS